MAGNVEAGQVDSIFGKLLSGRALIDLDGFKFDLGTLGGQNSWMNWGEINDFGQIVGYSETAALDPNGEDICGFGTHLTCRPYHWGRGMRSLQAVTDSLGCGAAMLMRHSE
jgi:hypothetical protein